MNIDFERLQARLKEHGDTANDLRAHYESLEARIESSVSAPYKGEWGDPIRVTQFSRALCQVLLNRLIRLFEGATQALLSENGYLLALSVRASFETTAVIGFLHKRLSSVKRQNLTMADVDRDLCVQFLGTRDKGLLSMETQHEVPEAKQILTMLEYADASLSREVLNGTAKQRKILTESYLWLCEFCHPNFHSHTLGFVLDVERQEYNFRYDTPLKDNELSIIEYLLICSPVFEEFHNRIETIVSSFEC